MAGVTGGSADLRIVLLGKTGVGKSSVGNTILGEKLFKTVCKADSETSECVAKTKTVDGRSITVIDTPGYFATNCTHEKLKPEIANCIVECSPGPHAFVIVLTVMRQTSEEKKVVDEIKKMFGEEALKYAVVLFTRGADLEDDQTIQQFVDENIHLKTLVQKCGNRLLVVDNKHWINPTDGHNYETRNAKEIQKLLNIIDQMVEWNRGKHYTNEMFQAVAQVIEDARVNIRKESGGLISEKIVDKRAKEKVKRFLIKAAGVSTGILMGALLGAVACVGSLVVLLVGLTIDLCTPDGVAAAAVAGAKGIAAASAATGIGFGAKAAADSAAVATGIGLGAEGAAVATGIGLGTAAGIAAGVLVGVGACGGAIAGGIIGAKAANEALTASEAAERAFHAVTEPAINFVMNNTKDKMQKAYKKLN